MTLDKVLVPLDGSGLAEAALWKAIELAGDSQPTLVLLRAAEAFTFPGSDPVDAQVEAVREAEEYLAHIATRVRNTGFKRVETHVWYGPAAGSIVEAARVQGADLIVMSTHGRSGLGRLILGSVAESVLRGTQVPILMVRAEGAPVETLAPARPVETTRV
ncbi:MAG: universal stress protein [Candidatus Rokubacteria bacterium]|nr:universal stress protein [Candidatus Rokubacteria bacterium]